MALVHFNPRSLHGERRFLCRNFLFQPRISIHAPCTGSDGQNRHFRQRHRISIHAPCTGSDNATIRVPLPVDYFNPRSLHGERPAALSPRRRGSRFQSTLPARGATFYHRKWRILFRNFNPRSLHGERHNNSVRRAVQNNFNPRSLHGERPRPAPGRLKLLCISIHAPCTGSDFLLCVQRRLFQFQSTLPARGATRAGKGRGSMMERFQSTLPARGATRRSLSKGGKRKYFNPRSLHGERPCRRVRWMKWKSFQSTLPARGATILAFFVHGCAKDFNPRSLHGERRHRLELLRPHDDFNPRSLHGERPGTALAAKRRCKFQSTLPARGATRGCGRRWKG